MRGARWLAIGAVLAVLTLPSSGAAASDVHLGVFGGAEFPIFGGAGVQLELPAGFLLGAKLGVVPPLFEELVNQALVNAGVYPATAGQAVLAHLDATQVRGAALGLRPWPRHGFFLEGGYTQLLIDGGVRLSEVAQGLGVNAAGAVALPGRFTVHTELELIEARLGWLWTSKLLFARLGLGAAFAIRSRSEVAFLENGTVQPVGPLTTVAGALLDEALRKWGRTPLVGAALGFHFF